MKRRARRRCLSPRGSANRRDDETTRRRDDGTTGRRDDETTRRARARAKGIMRTRSSARGAPDTRADAREVDLGGVSTRRGATRVAETACGGEWDAGRARRRCRAMVTMVSPRSPTWWRSRLGTQTNSLDVMIHPAKMVRYLEANERYRRGGGSRNGRKPSSFFLTYVLGMTPNDGLNARKFYAFLYFFVALILEHYLMLPELGRSRGRLYLCEIRRIREIFTRTLHQIPSFSDVDRYFRHRDVLQHRQSRKTD